jgi:hypothetical protein
MRKVSAVVIVVALGLVVVSWGSGGEPESLLVKSATTHKSFLVCLLDPATSARDCYTEFPQHRSSPTTGNGDRQRVAGAKLTRYVADFRIPLSDVQVVTSLVGSALGLGHSPTEAYRMMRTSGRGDISLNDKTLAGLTDLVLLAHYPGAGPREIHSCTARERCYHSGPQPPSNNASTVRPG